MKLDKRKPSKKRGKKVTILQCPHCDGTNVGYWSGYRPSGSYECYDCDYKGSFVIKKEAWIDDDGEMELVEDPPSPDD